MCPEHLHHLKRIVDGRTQQPIRLVPLAVQVVTDQIAAVVSEHNAIDVEHGHDPNDKVLAQGKRFHLDQLLQQAVKHMGGLRLARVHATSDDDGLLLAVVLDEFEQPLAEPLEGRVYLKQLLLIQVEELHDLGIDDIY